MLAFVLLDGQRLAVLAPTGALCWVEAVPLEVRALLGTGQGEVNELPAVPSHINLDVVCQSAADEAHLCARHARHCELDLLDGTHAWPCIVSVASPQPHPTLGLVVRCEFKVAS
jgi:hypothetical protein